jgi:hypothetical protein
MKELAEDYAMQKESASEMFFPKGEAAGKTSVISVVKSFFSVSNREKTFTTGGTEEHRGTLTRAGNI